MPYRSRGFIPHLDGPNSTNFITFRLAGTIPQNVLASWKAEKEELPKQAQEQRRSLSRYERLRIAELHMARVEEYLDRGMGDCWLRKPEIALIVQQSLLHFDSARYDLHAWSIMPNHVHVVITPRLEKEFPLTDILHSWKSFTAHQANKILERTGKFWQEEYYDHLIRSDDDFYHYANYTLQNPVKAGLCKKWEEWPWSGCSKILQNLWKE